MERRVFRYKGEDLPARITMGALRRFEKETGRDFLKIQASLSGSDLGIMLWCSVKSQTRAEKIRFDEDLEEFLDNVTPDEVSHWYVGTGQVEESETDEEGSKKKSSPE